MNSFSDKKGQDSISQFSENGTPQKDLESLIEAALIDQLEAERADRRRLEEMFRYQSYHDDITALPNRNFLYDRVTQLINYARDRDTRIGIILLDLDRFKTINDSLGYSAGDKLLREVAMRLMSITHPGDLITRISGDEFVIILKEAPEPPQVSRYAENIFIALESPFELNGESFHVTCSMGICFYPEDGHDVETLLRHADTAQHEAKAQGRNNYQFFTKEMNKDVEESLRIEQDLRKALPLNQFILYYQPIFNAETHSLSGLEALLRWGHPELGIITPDRFINQAEDSGVIFTLGVWIFHAVCRQIYEWRRAGYHVPTVAINISAQQFRRSDLADMIRTNLLCYGLPGDALGVEITERTLMQDNAETMEMLNRLNATDINIAIDDFGTGYSSLSYLKRFPVDKLKIDREFISGIHNNSEDAAIVDAILAMAHSLGLNVVAEGVELQGQLDYLRNKGCREVQGFLFSQALPDTEVTRLLSRARADLS